MKKPKNYARITSDRLPASVACPNCLHRLDAVTAAVLNGDFDRVGQTQQVSVKGKATRCAYCWALLMFTDDDGNLRMMTAEERCAYRLEPILAEIVESMRRQRKPPNFTQKTNN
jgi:hypothetical protein